MTSSHHVAIRDVSETEELQLFRNYICACVEILEAFAKKKTVMVMWLQRKNMDSEATFHCS